MEQYFLIERIKDRFMIDAFNSNIIKQTKGKLEILSSEVIKPRKIGVGLNKKGEIFCADKNYQIKEITKEKANKILKDMEINYSSWKNYMSNAEYKGSPHLSLGLGGRLY